MRSELFWYVTQRIIIIIIIIICICLIPLTEQLNRLNTGYEEHMMKAKISHLLYMDDLKLIDNQMKNFKNRYKQLLLLLLLLLLALFFLKLPIMFYFITPLHCQNYMALSIQERIKTPIKHWRNHTDTVELKCPAETPVPPTLCPSQIINGRSEVFPRTDFFIFVSMWKKLKLLS